MSKILVFLSMIFVFVGASSCTKDMLVPDNAMSAQEGEDYTVIIEGCGNQPVVGYTYCRFIEGNLNNQSVSLIVPPAKCKESNCVFYKIFFPDGKTPAMGGSIPKDQTVVTIPWKELVKRGSITKGDSGFWGVLLEVHWVDVEGRDRVSFAKGEIRLRVLSRQYTPLNRTENDSNFVWDWANGEYRSKMTTGMRAFTGRIK